MLLQYDAYIFLHVKVSHLLRILMRCVWVCLILLDVIFNPSTGTTKSSNKKSPRFLGFFYLEKILWAYAHAVFLSDKKIFQRHSWLCGMYINFINIFWSPFAVLLIVLFVDDKPGIFCSSVLYIFYIFEFEIPMVTF